MLLLLLLLLSLLPPPPPLLRLLPAVLWGLRVYPAPGPTGVWTRCCCGVNGLGDAGMAGGTRGTHAHTGSRCRQGGRRGSGT